MQDTTSATVCARLKIKSTGSSLMMRVESKLAPQKSTGSSAASTSTGFDPTSYFMRKSMLHPRLPLSCQSLTSKRVNKTINNKRKATRTQALPAIKLKQIRARETVKRTVLNKRRIKASKTPLQICSNNNSSNYSSSNYSCSNSSNRVKKLIRTTHKSLI